MNVSAWDSVPVCDYRSLPNAPGLYACLTSDGQPVYIGQARNIKDRWGRGHHRAIDAIYAGAVRIAWLMAPVEELTDIEATLLEQYSPSVNSAVVHTNAQRLQREWARRSAELKRAARLPLPRPVLA